MRTCSKEEVLNLLEYAQLNDHIEKILNDIERLDLIRTRSVQPDLEYIFKHALTQKVVYSGLLKIAKPYLQLRRNFSRLEVWHVNAGQSASERHTRYGTTA